MSLPVVCCFVGGTSASDERPDLADAGLPNSPARPDAPTGTRARPLMLTRSLCLVRAG